MWTFSGTTADSGIQRCVSDVETEWPQGKDVEEMGTATAEFNTSSVAEMAKAVRVTGVFAVDELSFDTLPVARPGTGQVPLKMKAVSPNYRDFLVVKGDTEPVDLAAPRSTCQ